MIKGFLLSATCLLLLACGGRTANGAGNASGNMNDTANNSVNGCLNGSPDGCVNGDCNANDGVNSDANANTNVNTNANGTANSNANGTNVANSAPEATQDEKDRVEVLYFHGKQRCATCRAIEKNAESTVKTRFADEMEKGTVVFRSVDLSRPENKALAEDYEVTWSSLFVNRWRDGRQTRENLTEFAFANARTAPDAFCDGLAKKIADARDR